MIFTVDWGSEKRTVKGAGRSNSVPERNAHEEHARYGPLPALIRDASDVTPTVFLYIIAEWERGHKKPSRTSAWGSRNGEGWGHRATAVAPRSLSREHG
ncbi:hypothetical protein [Burkholderia ubonensis]|uniref:hypothetical protein n=1 Tax=Burkholderia ubonensis TaxID=101571 RepID=UPI002ABD32B5|nr:hypothetical protein [Burkholderia ubonensis]